MFNREVNICSQQLVAENKALPGNCEVVCSDAVARTGEKYALREDLENSLRRIDDTARAVEKLDSKLNAELKDVSKELESKPKSLTMLSLAGMVCTLWLGVMAWILFFYIPSAIDAKVNALDAKSTKSLGETNERVSKTESKLDTLFDVLLKETTKGKPEEVKAKLTVAKNLLSEAENRDITLDLPLIKEGGLELVKYESPMPELTLAVWDTVTQFINYRSFLNQKLFPVIEKGQGEPLALPERGLAKVSNLTILGATQGVDHGDLENLTFIRCTIIYKGGEMRLKNVRFQDCQFRIEQNANGKKFAEAVLLSETPTEVF